MTPPTLLPAQPPAARMSFSAWKVSVSVRTVKPPDVRFTEETV